jgi:uncharacterized protein
MSADDFDDFDDVPKLQPLPPVEPSRDELRARYLKPGFGFWMAVVWCVVYFVCTQLVPLFVCGIPILAVAMVLDTALKGHGPGDGKAWLQSDTGATSVVIVLMTTQLVGLLFCWLILRWQCGGRTWKRKIALSRRPSMTHAVLVLIGAPAMIICGMAIEQPIFKYVPSIQDLLNLAGIDLKWEGVEAAKPLMQFAPWPLTLFTIGVLPAFNEEFWCRGFLAQGLGGRYRPWAVILMTSFLFGCIHVEPRQGLWAMFLGAAICSAYFATRSLWVPMFLHFANNGLAAIHENEQLGFHVLRPIEDLAKGEPALLFSSAIILFVAVAYALHQTRCKLTPIELGLPTWEPEGVTSMELPPPNSATVVSHDPISPTSVVAVAIAALGFGMVLAFA